MKTVIETLNEQIENIREKIDTNPTISPEELEEMEFAIVDIQNAIEKLENYE